MPADARRPDARWLLVAAALVAGQAIALRAMGQPWICDCGVVKLWGAAGTSDNSQHLADWYTLSHVIHGFVFYGALWLALAGLAPPLVFAFAVTQGAALTRMMRSSMLDVLDREHLDTARAKGLREHRVIIGHGVRNGSVPVVTLVGLQIGNLLSGAVVVESIFALPGLGSMVVSAVTRRDFPVIQGVVLILGFVAGFIAMLLIRSSGFVPVAALDVSAILCTVMLGCGLFALGAGVVVRSLLVAGGRSLALGLISTIVACLTALVGIKML